MATYESDPRQARKRKVEPMKLPKSSKSAQRRTAWKARCDARVRVDVETRPAFGLDFATAAGADRSVVHAYAFDAAASLSEGARLVDSHGAEYEDRKSVV